MKTYRFSRARSIFFGFVFAQFFCVGILAQTNGLPSGKAPAKAGQLTAAAKVTQIDALGLKRLLKPNGKPLLVNFWATWCDPCREEFPDLVKIDAEYRGKIDFLTISLDDVEDKDTAVPKFLTEMKAEMPAYLLVTPDEGAAISAVSKDWSGGLPFTILFNEKGGMAYFRQGKIKPEIVKAKIDELITAKSSKDVAAQQIVELSILPSAIYSYETGTEQAKRDLAEKRYTIKRYGLTPGIPQGQLAELKAKYSVEISSVGCMVPAGYPEYARGYNEMMKAALLAKFGAEILQQISF